MEIRMPYVGTFRCTNLWGVEAPAGVTYSAGYHTGMDFVGVDDKSILAVCSGTVYRSSMDSSGWGNYVVIKQDDGYFAIYAHLSQRDVLVGEYVSAGDSLGIEGATGQVTGAHLHFELRKDYTDKYSSIDPSDYLGIANVVGVVEVIEVVSEIEIDVNGEVRTVNVIEKDGYNYVKLQDLRDDKIQINYDSENKRPQILVVQVFELF